jgi:MFS family permease
MRELVPRSSDELRLAMTVGKSEDTLWRPQLLRWSGAAAILGGLLCVLAAFLHSLEPSGCIGLECETRPMRSATGLVPALTPTAALLVLIGIAGLTLMARQSPRFKKLAGSGLISAAAGLALLFLGALIQAALFNGDFPWMPLFVIPGVLGVIVGFALIGVFVLRSAVLPRWLGVYLVASSVVLLAANEQTAAVLLAIPFGLAVATVGFFMWNQGNHPYTKATAPA